MHNSCPHCCTNLHLSPRSLTSRDVPISESEVCVPCQCTYIIVQSNPFLHGMKCEHLEIEHRSSWNGHLLLWLFLWFDFCSCSAKPRLGTSLCCNLAVLWTSDAPGNVWDNLRHPGGPGISDAGAKLHSLHHSLFASTFPLCGIVGLRASLGKSTTVTALTILLSRYLLSSRAGRF